MLMLTIGNRHKLATASPLPPTPTPTPAHTPWAPWLQLEEHTFDPLEPQYGFTTLISRSELLDPAAGFLRDDGGVLLRASLVPMPC